MALIDCPECGREVSSSAAVCPVCAYPVSTGTTNGVERAPKIHVVEDRHPPPRAGGLGGDAGRHWR